MKSLAHQKDHQTNNLHLNVQFLGCIEQKLRFAGEMCHLLLAYIQPKLIKKIKERMNLYETLGNGEM